MIRVHFHLKRHVFVVSERTPKGWRVMRYTDALCLRNVRFVVSDKGREYCRAKGMRWVHAWAEGTLCACATHRASGVRVTYNPFRDTGFRTQADGTPVTEASHAAFTLEVHAGKRRPVTLI